MTATLPKDFSVLQPFVQKWALPTEYERGVERRRSTPTELKAFYDAILPLVPQILKDPPVTFRPVRPDLSRQEILEIPRDTIVIEQGVIDVEEIDGFHVDDDSPKGRRGRKT